MSTSVDRLKHVVCVLHVYEPCSSSDGTAEQETLSLC